MSKIRLIRGSDVEMQPLEYVIEGLIFRSKLNILMGKGACGKTTVALDLAARVSRGGSFNGVPVLGGSVIVWSCEDDIKDTLAPRLSAADADMSRINFLDGMDEFHDKRSFDFHADLPSLV